MSLGSGAYPRWRRAELLRALGRDDEALRWYTTLAETAPSELVFLAPPELGQAELYERRGDRARAAEHYRRAATLWRDCDPALRPTLTRAEQRAAALGG